VLGSSPGRLSIHVNRDEKHATHASPELNIKSHGEDDSGEWLQRLPSHSPKVQDIACFDTKVISVNKDKLVWAKCAGFKGSGYFPARLCDSTELLKVCKVNEWPLPADVAVVEYFDIPRTCATATVVQVKKKQTRPYYHRYQRPNNIEGVLRHRKNSADADELGGFDDNEHEAEENDHEDYAVTDEPSDYTQWDPATMEQMHMVRD
jgi:hypothetical protein